MIKKPDENEAVAVHKTCGAPYYLLDDNTQIASILCFGVEFDAKSAKRKTGRRNSQLSSLLLSSFIFF